MTSDVPSDPRALAEAAIQLGRARRVVVFTGAGVSAESGIPTFRDAGGFWDRFPPEVFASWSGLRRVAVSQPRRVAEFLEALLDPIVRAVPNPAHRAIADLQRHAETVVVTQNVDGLHQAAGSRAVLEVHGSFYRLSDLRGRIVGDSVAGPVGRGHRRAAGGADRIFAARPARAKPAVTDRGLLAGGVPAGGGPVRRFIGGTGLGAGSGRGDGM